MNSFVMTKLPRMALLGDVMSYHADETLDPEDSSHDDSGDSIKVARFWARYIQILEKEGEPEESRNWYVRRVEEWIEAGAEKLSQRKPQAMVTYVEERRKCGRISGSMADWADADSPQDPAYQLAGS